MFRFITVYWSLQLSEETGEITGVDNISAEAVPVNPICPVPSLTVPDRENCHESPGTIALITLVFSGTGPGVPPPPPPPQAVRRRQRETNPKTADEGTRMKDGRRVMAPSRDGRFVSTNTNIEYADAGRVSPEIHGTIPRRIHPPVARSSVRIDRGGRCAEGVRRGRGSLPRRTQGRPWWPEGRFRRIRSTDGDDSPRNRKRFRFPRRPPEARRSPGF